MKKFFIANMTILLVHPSIKASLKAPVRKFFEKKEKFRHVPAVLKQAMADFEHSQEVIAKEFYLTCEKIVTLQGAQNLYGLIENKCQQIFAVLYRTKTGSPLPAFFTAKGLPLRTSCSH